MTIPAFEVLVVGGGPAGMAAALVLGRCRRRVLLCDDGRPRNSVTQAIHGFLTRDGCPPEVLRSLGREELARYRTIEVRDVSVMEVRRTPLEFRAVLGDGTECSAKKVVLATGLRDVLPEVPGARELFGRFVFHCPYCDGYELSEQPLIAYGRGDAKGADLALELTVWSRKVVLCSDGPAELGPEKRRQLESLGIRVREERILRLRADEGNLNADLDGGDSLRARALFFNTRAQQISHLAAGLGCELDDKGCVPSCADGATSSPGLYVIGDAARGLRQVAVAAGEGAAAAVAVNTALLSDALAG